MDRRKQTGQRGEDIAASFFMERGYTILDRNWRCAGGELDIVMEKDERLIFVEVRTRASLRLGSATESVTQTKQNKLIELAHSYLQEMDPPHKGWQIDVAAVWLGSGDPQVHHLENAIGW